MTITITKNKLKIKKIKMLNKLLDISFNVDYFLFKLFCIMFSANVFFVLDNV